MDKFWIFAVCLLTVEEAVEPIEIKHGKVGENIIIMDIDPSLVLFRRLYHHDKLIATIWDSSCDVNTKSPLYCRLRCSRDRESNKTRIEIANVTENDTGLYKLDTEEGGTEQCLLNITVTSTTVANVLYNENVPELSDGNNSSQPTGESLSPTVTNSPVIMTNHRIRECQDTGTRFGLYHIILTATVTALMILLLIGCVIWIKRRNINSIETVQRIVLETNEAASSTTPSTLRRCQLTLPREEGWTNHSIFQPVAVENTRVKLQIPAPPKHATSVYRTYNSTLEKVEYDNHELEVIDNISDLHEPSSWANQKFFEDHHEGTGFIREGSPSFSAVHSLAESKARFESPILEATWEKHVARRTEDTYTMVNKVSKASSKNNEVSHPIKVGALFMDGNETVDLSHFGNPITTLQDAEIALVSAGNIVPPFKEPSSSMNDFYHGTKEGDCYQIFADGTDKTSAESFRVYDDEDVLSIKEEEHEKQTTIPNID